MSSSNVKDATWRSNKTFGCFRIGSKKNEILTGIMKTKQKISIFEKTFSLSTGNFMIRGHQEMSQISEMDAIEWFGEHETLKKLQEKL